MEEYPKLTIIAWKLATGKITSKEQDVINNLSILQQSLVIATADDLEDEHLCKIFDFSQERLNNLRQEIEGLL